MSASAIVNAGAWTGGQKGEISIYEDPLDPDARDDVAVTTTRRGLTRLALVAAQTGARFQRDCVKHDAMAWLLAPRALFGGSAALTATLERDNCLRAVVLHGLSRDFDAEPGFIDVLLADDLGGAGDGQGGWGDPWSGGDNEGDDGPIRIRRMRLYSAVAVVARGGELVHLLHASVAPNASVVRERIRSRFGSATAEQAEIQVGVDLQDEFTAKLLPPVFRTMLTSGRRLRWSTMPGFDVTVEHRIRC